MSQNLVSIITPVYQVEQYLPQCLDSILAQSYSRWELILVDDGSFDQSGEICNQYAQKDQRIHVIHTENRGAAAARNTGLKYASGEYIVFVDGDDYIAEGMIETLYRNLCQSEYDMVMCNFLRTYPDGVGDFSPPLQEMEISGRDVLAHLKTQKNYGLWTVVWNKMCKKELLKNLRFPEGRYFEDEIFSDQWLLRCKSIHVIPDVLYVNRVRTSSTMNTQKTRNYLDLIDAFRLRIELYQEQKLPVNEIYKILIFMLEPYSQCTAAHFQGEDGQRLCQTRRFIRKTARQLLTAELAVMKKVSLVAIAACPSITFRAASRFRGLLEKYL